uniref:Bm4556 n=1 Tax=Brugia malayi TaxID=6279 RepID=A0A0H5S1N2_BRUMA|nr:Bm4556 [Brugia malayi]
MKPLKGITIGDMGEKIGDWNSIDNGWIKFNKHRFHLNALLNRFATVHPNGTYQSIFKTIKEQQLANLSILSIGRATVVGKGIMANRLAVIIATRYSAIRKQFRMANQTAKVLSTEEGVNALDDARLACGAYGLNDLRNAFDPARTFEGDNNILMQQVTYALISLYDEKSYDWNDSPLRSLIFLAMKPKKFSTWNDDALEDIANAYVWLLHFLISKVKDDISDKINQGIDKRQAQSEQYKMITYAYCELTILNDFRNSLQKAPESIREVLHRCALLYAYSSIDKHIATFYIGGYCNNGQWGNTIKKRFRKLEAMILPDVITICDALSLPDFFLHSVLGLSDGQIYQNLIQYFMQFPIESSIDSNNSDNNDNNNNINNQ